MEFVTRKGNVSLRRNIPDPKRLYRAKSKNERVSYLLSTRGFYDLNVLTQSSGEPDIILDPSGENFTLLAR